MPRYFWMPYALLMGLFLANNLAGCGSSQAQHRALNTMTDVVDPTYAQTVDTCDDLRDAVIAREGTSYAEDRRAMERINEVCDALVASFEGLRGVQLTARAYLDTGLEGAAAQAIQEGLQLWHQLRGMIPQLDELGRTPDLQEEF